MKKVENYLRLSVRFFQDVALSMGLVITILSFVPLASADEPKVGDYVIPQNEIPANAAPGYGRVIDVEAEKQKAVAGGYDITMNGVRYGDPTAIAKHVAFDAQKGDVNGVIWSKQANEIETQKRAGIKAQMQDTFDYQMTDKNLSDEKRAEMTAAHASTWTHFGEDPKPDVVEIVEVKPKPEPTVYPPPRVLVSGRTEVKEIKQTALVSGGTEVAQPKQRALTSHGENS